MLSGPIFTGLSQFSLSIVTRVRCLFTAQQFPGVRLEAEVTYFIDDCISLSEEQKAAIGQQFVSNLYSSGVCKDEDVETCTIKDVITYCGLVNYDLANFMPGKRRKRSWNSRNELRVNFTMEMSEVPVQNANCREKCHEEVEGLDHCIWDCEKQYRETRTQTLYNATQQIEMLFDNVKSTMQINSQVPSRRSDKVSTSLMSLRTYQPHYKASAFDLAPADEEALILRYSGLTLVPTGAIRTKQAETYCEPGMVHSNRSSACGKYGSCKQPLQINEILTTFTVEKS